MKRYLQQFMEWVTSLPFNIFEHARIRLTLVYTLIMTLVILSFSFTIYNVISINVAQTLNSPENQINLSLKPEAEKQVYEKIMDNVINRIKFVDILVILVITLANYFFVGEILKPIENAVEKQKRFSSDASHDMRTPLTIMKTEIEVALGNQNYRIEDYKKVLSSNLEEIDSLTKLINDLLLLSRIDNRKIVIDEEKVQTKTLLEKIISEFSFIAQKKQINITENLTDMDICINEGLFRRAVGNLISNAITYSPANSEIKITSKKSGAFALIEICDNGIGIPKKELPKVFDRFYKVSNSRKDDQGSGIGLSITKEIVEYYQGKVEISSDAGKGTKVTIKIPLL